MGAVAVEAVASRGGLSAFVRFPERLYQKNPLWVAPLRGDHRALLSPSNPFFMHAEVRLLLARRSAEVVGRLAVILDHQHLERWGEKVGFFGFFESIHDVDVARALLDAARAWLRPRGMAIIRGPVSPSANHECGLLVEGFDAPPRVLMPYNMPYYPALLERAGFKAVKELVSYDIDLPEAFPERLAPVARAAEERGIRVRPFNPRALQQEAQVIRLLYNAAWNENWGFVPMSEAEAAFMARRLRHFLVPEFALIAEWQGQPVGFVLSLPDYTPALSRLQGRITPWGIVRFLWRRRSLDEIRVMAMGVLPGYRKRGIDALLIRATFEEARRRRYQRAELSWVLEDNALMRRTIERLGGKVAKRYRLYESSV